MPCGREGDKKISVVYVSTKNEHKLKEIKAILAPSGFWAAAFPDMPEIEETGSSFEENASLKAAALSRLTDEYVIADDSGISVDALGGAPGVYSARYAGIHGDDAANNKKLLKDMENEDNRACRFVCAVALAKKGRVIKAFRGEATGFLARVPCGKGGFGYDPVFVLPDGRHMAELSPDEKNAVSHRRMALEALCAYLKTEEA